MSLFVICQDTECVRYGVECSTFFWQRVAKASLGLIPPPFLITYSFFNELTNPFKFEFKCKVTAQPAQKQGKCCVFDIKVTCQAEPDRLLNRLGNALYHFLFGLFFTAVKPFYPTNGGILHNISFTRIDKLVRKLAHNGGFMKTG